MSEPKPEHPASGWTTDRGRHESGESSSSRAGLWFAIASFSLTVGALILFGIAIAGDGAGPGGVPIFFAAMGLMAFAPIAALLAVVVALSESALSVPSRFWRIAIMALAAAVYLWWFFIASSQLRVPQQAIFVPAPLPAAASVIAVPSHQVFGALGFLAFSLGALVVSWIVFGMTGT